MRTYRFSVLSLLIFVIGYPLLSGSVLIMQWDSGFGEIYPFAPWALFCFVPNQEGDFAVRLRTVDGRALEPPPFFANYSKLTPAQKNVGYAIVQEMGHFARGNNTPEFRKQRLLFEQNYLRPLAQNVRYELVHRTYEVLERWRLGKYESVDVMQEFVFSKDSEGI